LTATFEPFVLTTTEIGEYDIKYLGATDRRVGTYTFGEAEENGKRAKSLLRRPRIWVDDRDLQIVRTFGKGVGIRKGDGARSPS